MCQSNKLGLTHFKELYVDPCITMPKYLGVYWPNKQFMLGTGTLTLSAPKDNGGEMFESNKIGH